MPEPDHQRKLPGRRKASDITLKRGVTPAPDLAARPDHVEARPEAPQQDVIEYKQQGPDGKYVVKRLPPRPHG